MVDLEGVNKLLKNKIMALNEVELALEMNKLVHNECKDVPHDIGLRLLDIVKKNLEFEQPKDTLVSKIKQRIESEYRKHPDLDWAEIAARKIYAEIINEEKQ